MTEFAHAVNFTMDFGVTVLPEDINKIRKELDGGYDGLMLWDIELNKHSTDEEIANYIGLESYADHFLSEAVNMEMDVHHVYSKEDTERLRSEYEEKLQMFKEANKK